MQKRIFNATNVISFLRKVPYLIITVSIALYILISNFPFEERLQLYLCILGNFGFLSLLGTSFYVHFFVEKIESKK